MSLKVVFALALRVLASFFECTSDLLYFNFARMIMGVVLCEGQEHKFEAVNLKLIRNQLLFPQLDCKLPLGFLQVALIKFHHQIQSYYLIMECLY